MGEQNISTPAIPEEKTETKDNGMTVSAAPATVTISADQVADGIVARLTTAEKETGSETGSVKDRLLTVKSIVTLLLTAAFAFLSVTGKIESDQFMTVFTTVIAFYFGVQTVKGKE